MVGNDTDTTRDYEYTDWDAVERFADAFAQQLEQK
jgi:menaquinone-dependent protoporphyrinogen oxidase